MPHELRSFVRHGKSRAPSRPIFETRSRKCRLSLLSKGQANWNRFKSPEPQKSDDLAHNSMGQIFPGFAVISYVESIRSVQSRKRGLVWLGLNG
jgi:hypothetical protein